MQSPNAPSQITPIDWAKRLKADTEAVHQEAESKGIFKRLFNPDLTLSDYSCFLADLYERLAPIEIEILRSSDLTKLPSVQSRITFPALSQDIKYFGINTPSLGGPFPISGLGSLVGTLYVLEGSAHGGCIFHKHLLNHLSITESTGLAYFSTQAQSVHTRFKAFREEINQLLDENHYNEALATAKLTFQRFL